MKPKHHSDCPTGTNPLEEIRIRRLQAGDCLERLTGMLHRAFSRLGEMGVPCACVTQSPEVTRQRVERGDCFVAMCGDRMVGTISLYAPDAASATRHYRDCGVATARQLGVDPQFQGRGLGTALLQLAERWARNRGYARLALDTPEPATHLIDYYHGQGFSVVERLQFAGRPYRSVIFAKALGRQKAGAARLVCRHGAHRLCAAGAIRHRHLISPAVRALRAGTMRHRLHLGRHYSTPVASKAALTRP
jgi:GNAT superfamily N-acetyltransferase